MSRKNESSGYKASGACQKNVRKGNGRGADSSTLQWLKSNLGHLASSAKVGGKVQMYEQVAGDLSLIAGRADRPWTWRYVQGVEVGTILPGREFVRAFEVFMEDLSPREKQWFYFLRRRSLAAVFEKSVLRSQIVKHMEALGFRTVSFTVYDQARKRIRGKKLPAS